MIHVHVTIENILKEVAVITVKIWTIFQTSLRLVKKKIFVICPSKLLPNIRLFVDIVGM
jgi:hypothetical protein